MPILKVGASSTAICLLGLSKLFRFHEILHPRPAAGNGDRGPGAGMGEVVHRRQKAAKRAVESDAAEMANHLYWIGDYLRNDHIERLKEKYKPLLNR
jgi:hypothetical protein